MLARGLQQGARADSDFKIIGDNHKGTVYPAPRFTCETVDHPIRIKAMEKMLKDKVAIITGAGSGFGKATAKLFAEKGAAVVVVDMNTEAAQAVAGEIQADERRAIAVTADVTKEDDVKNFIDQAIKHFGKIDVLFNNAGVYVPGNVEETEMDGWLASLNVNLTGVYLGCKYAMPHLKKTKGSIINTASAGGVIGFPDAFGYATTKGGVISATRAIAVDYADDGVRANAIAPGTGVTGMTEDLLKDENVYDAFVSPIPMHRLGQPQDVAGAALFLASDYASYVTGATIPVDGGWTMS